MNTFQKQMIQQFPYTITIDSTHGLNGYDFELTTIMVLDEYHHGFPVAEMFTNRKDTVVQSIFFSAIKKSVGIKIADKDKRAEIYKILKNLQQETSEANFASALDDALSYMHNNEKTTCFGEYFTNTYSHNFRKWAYCFRGDSIINTNMHLESMHKTIKYFYLDRKTVKRLDKGLNAVLKYVRDKSVERIIRLVKSEHTKQTRLLCQNHQKALKTRNEYVLSKNRTNWIIFKNGNSSSYYTINQ
ncbi:hypothetical protein D910_00115, partial [Dendroctonus ponderosae]